ncbi:MAG: ABC transporter substrate-binding protein [Pelagibacteraceae bacterium]|nr:ABC transporter substrate-binding protein [Pelagibacteraceae bacterium]
MNILKIIAFTSVFLITQNIYAKTTISHAIAMHGEPKYAEDFISVEYISNSAEKGGAIVRSAIGSYDTFNPFTLKGSSPAGIGLLFESLTLGSSDEAFTEYGLLAKNIEWPEDRSWVSFTLRKEAEWHDGKKITSEDIIWTFNTLMEKGHPFYGYYYGDIKEVIKISEDKVKFIFATNTNKELPLIVGQLPVLPKHYWENKNFEETTLDIPLGSGPYKIKSFDAGRSITYELNEDYWGFKNNAVPIKVGKDNIGTIRYDYYKDRGVEREAFKSGEIDFFSENTSKEWATGYNIGAVEEGLIKKELISHENPQGMQAFAFNTRKEIFKDKRIRKALAYAFDFEWTNKNLFYGAYNRTDSFFENSELASYNLPSEKELQYLNPYIDLLPKEVFNSKFQNPYTDGSGFIRKELQEATNLIKAAGWILQDGKLVNSKNQPFEFEILLVSPAFERIVLPFIDNLEKLGINATLRTVDSSQYQKRIESFDFDMIVYTFSQSLSPGNEQRNFWGSNAADTNGSRNVIGIKNEIVDSLIEKLINAKDRQDLITITRALDRVLLWNYYVIPQWHISAYRVLYWDMFDQPKKKPKYSLGFDTWWINQNKFDLINSQRSAN